MQEHRKKIEEDYIRRTNPSTQRIEREKAKMIDSGIYQTDLKVQSDLERQYMAAQSARMQLRDSLLSQIREK